MAEPTAQEETLRDEKATCMECIFVTTERGTPFDGFEMWPKGLVLSHNPPDSAPAHSSQFRLTNMSMLK